MTSVPQQSDEAPPAVLPQPGAPAEPPAATGRGAARLVVACAVATAVLAGAGLAAYAYAGDVPRGTRVLSVDLGGKSRAEAERLLADTFGPRAGEPVRVALGGRPVQVEPAAVGLTLDVDATVGRAMKGGVRLSGTRVVDPVIRLDQAKLQAALRRKLDPKDALLQKPGISYVGLTPKPTYPAAGRTVDPAAAAAVVRRTWLTGRTADVPLVEQPPVTSREQVDQLVETLARPAVAAPVTVSAGGREFTIPPAAIAKGLVFRSDDAGRLTAVVDAEKLRAAAAKEFAEVEVEPAAASIALDGGRPRIVASTAGRSVDLAKLGPALLAVLPERGPRRITAELVRREAATTDEDMAKLGVRERVSTFTTYFTGGRSSPRSQNIVTIAKDVDGAIVRPGRTFSLNRHTGERTYASGYRDAPVIVDGKLEPGVGGGASQFATTLFNAAYYAGLEDVEHKPHSFYFDRYPSVIESTIYYPTLDLKFRNTTPYGILIDTSTTSKSVTVSMWSTKYYDSVRTERSPRRNVTAPPTVYREPGPKCIASSGLPGFTQDAWRIIRKDGKQVKREKFTWTYDPEPRFICGKEPS